MKLFGPLASATCAAIALVGIAGASPSLAGPAETKQLEGYIGSWSGRGVVTGADKETVVCRMTITDGNDDKVNYTGRCAMAGTTVSVNGTLAYIDARKRYEAAMTTNAGFTGLAIGKKSGSDVVFDLREKAEDEAGNDLNVTAGITLSGETINVDFNVVFVSSGDSLSAKVPFTK